ncbi:unnamed protein product [marine sediment metagenome]|uniref:MmgE/PrpD N-terminal domain-containing protein n=1 Tax=marine sediment metagenome TaxID=412755 RepID=X1EHR2_9ZZZZ
MELERKLARYVLDTSFDDLPREAVDTIKNVVLTIFGTTLAGAAAEGCETLVDQVKKWGGREEATILIYGGPPLKTTVPYIDSGTAALVPTMPNELPISMKAKAVPRRLSLTHL